MWAEGGSETGRAPRLLSPAHCSMNGSFKTKLNMSYLTETHRQKGDSIMSYAYKRINNTVSKRIDLKLEFYMRKRSFFSSKKSVT